MKTQHWLTALLVFFTCSTVVYAGQSVHNTNHKLDGLTQDDGITALEAGDALGFEVLSREELESVRGEGFKETLRLVWDKSLAVRTLVNAYAAWSMVGWELGRMQAIQEGLPDPGKNPGYSPLKHIVYFVADRM
jgi:hypothetical protein